MATNNYFGSAIGFDRATESFVVGSHDIKGNRLDASATNYSVSEVNKLLQTVANSNKREDHELLAAAIVEPIVQIIPYIESYAPTFLMDVTYEPLEDNSVPVEDIHSVAFESHPESGAAWVKAGFKWYRPTWSGPYQTSLRVPHKELRYAGWNLLARAMKRAADAMARKYDNVAKLALEAAVPAAHQYTLSGGTLTKAAVDEILKDQTAVGFPVRRVLINSARVMDMATFVFPVGNFLPAEEQRQLLTTLVIKNYGGVDIYANPWVPRNVIYFGGTPDQIGYRQLRGAMTNLSDVDIEHQEDRYVMVTPEYAVYIGNANSLATLTLT